MELRNVAKNPRGVCLVDLVRELGIAVKWGGFPRALQGRERDMGRRGLRWDVCETFLGFWGFLVEVGVTVLMYAFAFAFASHSSSSSSSCSS